MSEPCQRGCRAFKDWTIEHYHAVGRWPVGWCSETCTRRPKVSAPTGRMDGDTAPSNEGGPGAAQTTPTRGQHLRERH